MSKIVYGVSGEGSGHSSRASEIIPFLLELGHEIIEHLCSAIHCVRLINSIVTNGFFVNLDNSTKRLGRACPDYFFQTEQLACFEDIVGSNTIDLQSVSRLRFTDTTAGDYRTKMDNRIYLVLFDGVEKAGAIRYISLDERVADLV